MLWFLNFQKCQKLKTFFDIAEYMNFNDDSVKYQNLVFRIQKRAIYNWSLAKIGSLKSKILKRLTSEFCP